MKPSSTIPIQTIAIAHPNIAFIKYWGNRDNDLRIPLNGSISMNLDSLTTQTTVEIQPDLLSDKLIINGRDAARKATERISVLVDLVRKMSKRNEYALVSTVNNFPVGSGIASSASGFAALALAASVAYGLNLSEKDLSRLARRGSGSACRSVPSGFVEWQAGTSDDDSYAFTIAPLEHWDLVDLIAIVDKSHKKTGSTEGHQLAYTSPFQHSRVEDAPRRLQICRQALLERNFVSFASVVELDCLMMHAVMMTSTPDLLYWKPATLEVIQKVTSLRAQGLPVCYTIDAGANVHILTPKDNISVIQAEVQKMNIVQSLLVSGPGGAVYIPGCCSIG
jgi:diphosphomevalonate decarboxylase